MRRIWIGIGILVVLLALGLVVMKITHQQLGAVADTLKQASENRDWDEAVVLAQKAEQDWQQKRHWMAALADHADIDNVDEIFAQLAVYQQRRSETDHAAACAQLAEAICDLEENYRLTWRNLL